MSPAPATATKAKPLTAPQVLKQLKALGTAQNRKIYARHGAPSTMFGVSYAELGKLKKKLKTNHEVAMKLWDSGMLDAQILATMVCDPAQLTKSDCDRWAKDSTCYQLTGALGGPIARSPHAISRYEKWRKAKGEFVQTAAWSVLAGVVKHTEGEPDAATLRDAIKMIEANIHTAPNRARESMNTCLIAIGTYRKPLRKAAIAAAKRIGPVEIDHGETGCKTPDAASYIEKAAAHLERKKGK